MAVMSHLIVFAKGFCMGTADVVPGVSGGTMAFILGIYQRLLEAIRAFDWQLLNYLSRRQIRLAMAHVDMTFLLFLGLGIGAALLFFTRVISLPGLLDSHPEQVYGLFFGLISASIILLLRSVARFAYTDIGILVSGVVVGWSIVNLVPLHTPQDAWFMFVSGAVAICAMILPGVSGAFILLILNQYAYVLEAIGRFDLAVLVPFGLGAAIGLMLFSRFLVWLLHRYYKQAVLGIAGMLMGSLWMMWPFQQRTYEIVRDRPRLIHSVPIWPDELNTTVLATLAWAVVGTVLVLSISAVAGKAGAGHTRGLTS